MTRNKSDDSRIPISKGSPRLWVLTAVATVFALTGPIMGLEEVGTTLQIYKVLGWDGYRSKFDNPLEKGVSRLFFGYSAMVAEMGRGRFGVWSQFDTSTAETYDRDEFTRPASVTTVDRGRSDLERFMGLRYQSGENNALTLENRRHRARYEYNYTEGLTRAIDTSIVYDDTTLSLMRNFGKYGPMGISMGVFLEAGRDNHLNRLKRVTNYLAGPALDLKLQGPFFDNPALSGTFTLGLELSGGLGFQSHGPGDWTLVASGHGQAKAGITAEF